LKKKLSPVITIMKTAVPTLARMVESMISANSTAEDPTAADGKAAETRATNTGRIHPHRIAAVTTEYATNRPTSFPHRGQP
jgi:hypothetical protein